MKNILGGKGAGLAEMSSLDLPIPAGFTIATDLCEYFYKNNRNLPENFSSELLIAIKKLENITGKIFAGHSNPIIFSYCKNKENFQIEKPRLVCASIMHLSKVQKQGHKTRALIVLC